MRRHVHSAIALACLAGTALAATGAAAAAPLPPSVTAEFLELPTLPLSNYATPSGINGKGQVVGMSLEAGTGVPHAIAWSPTGALHDLAANAEAQAINDDERIVGRVGYAAGYWQQGVFHRVADVGNNNAVNAKGIMAGDDDTNLALFSRKGERRLGGLYGANHDTAHGLNLSLDEVGVSSLLTGPGLLQTLPHLHRDGQSTMALPIPGNNGSADAINDAGLIVGASWQVDSQGNTQWSCAVRWDQLQPSCLPWSTPFAGARAVDAQGHIVGWGRAADGRSHAVLWTATGAVDLNDWLPATWRDAGWVLTSANAINGGSAIAGEMVGADGRTVAWLLRLVPTATP